MIRVALVAVGVALLSWGRIRADAARHEVDPGSQLLFLPSGQAMKVASLGFHLQAADLLWVRAVLTFGERWQKDPDPAWQAWLAGMIDAITVLDPAWRTPYFYGGVMLRVTGDIEASNRVFEAGAAAFPDDAFFPFAVGMNHYMYLDDLDAAERWLAEAARRPDAPDWYALAARAFRLRRYEGQMAIRYLREEIARTSDPKIREALEERLRREMHDERSRQLTEAWEACLADCPRPPAALEDLVRAGRIPRVPEDPLGEGWVLDVEGDWVSEAVARDRAERAVRFERDMLRADGRLAGEGEGG